MKTIVIALGGNAILRKGDKPTIETQLRNTRNALKALFPLIRNNRVVITHGNGPAVGYLLLQQELARKKIAPMPLDVLDAETEGQIGYLIQQNVQNLFRKHSIKRGVAAILTQVLVDETDPAFDDPTKFVGPFYTKQQARALGKKFTIKEDVGRGWRRVVPSPEPQEIIEKRIIKKLLRQNAVVIAAGGGGIPVVKEQNQLHGVEAVIDKDLASACLAHSIGADELIIVTDIDGAYLNYKKKGQRKINEIRKKELEKYYKAGAFLPGSMGPKIAAALHFLHKRGRTVTITDINHIHKGGTIIK